MFRPLAYGQRIRNNKEMIIVDTREQKPLFTGSGTVRRKLLVGDYSTIKLEHVFSVERKSLQDLYGTITKGHLRFRKEIVRAEANDIELVLVVEGTRKDFVNKNFPGGAKRKMDGETLGKIIDTMSRRYNFKIYWCASVRSARMKTKKLLLNYKKHGRTKI